MRAKSIFVVASLYCLLLFGACRAQLEAVNIGEVVENLGRRFQEIRNEGLGIDRLEEAYRRTDFDFETLTPSITETIMSQTDSDVSAAVSAVTTLFDSVVDGTQGQPMTPSDCCSTSGSGACCFQCGSMDSRQSDLAARVAGLFSDNSLPGGSELFFGFSNGPTVRYPANPPNCTEQDSRLQRWFRRSFQKPLEVVLVVSLSNPNPSFYRDEFSETLKEAARYILRSLTQQDRVAVVRADFASMLPLVISRLADDVRDLETLPVCDDTIAEMEQFAVSVSDPMPMPSEVNVTNAFVEALNLFSNNASTEKVLVSILPGASTIGANEAAEFMTNAIADRGNDILVSSYRVLDDVGSSRAFEQLSQAGPGGGANAVFRDFSLVLVPNIIPLVGAFYSRYLLNTSVTTPMNVIGSRFTAEGGPALTLSRPVVNGTSLIGVLHAELPLQQILSRALTALASRPSSYVFIASLDNIALFHPLLPVGYLSDVSVFTIEEKNSVGSSLLRNLLRGTSPGTTMSLPLSKTLLISTTANDVVGFAVRRVPATYFCRQSELVYVCLLLADEDLTVASLNQQSVDVDGTYSSEPSRRPLYHNLQLSAPNTDTCDYFCTSTVTDRISFQLTSPSQPPRADDQSLVNEATTYIRGTGPRPSWVVDGVSQEISLGSAVVSQWIDATTNISDYISRRHLATPSGAYLTFPPTQFVPEYRPRNTDWYTTAVAHPSLITLVPPREGLREGSRLTVSVGYAVGTPTSESNSTLSGSQTLSVVAADLTLDTLRVFIRESLPLCEQNSQVSCLIIDDLGNIIYDDVVVRDIRYRGPARFFGSNFERNTFQGRRQLISHLLGSSERGLFVKHKCEDYYVIGIDTVQFYQINLDHIGSNSGFGVGGCLNYQIQRIPGTNAFLMALQETRQCSAFCFCPAGDLPQCVNCDVFSTDSCECPCICRAECHDRSPASLTCPQRMLDGANQNLASNNVSPAPDACFNQACNCRTDFDSCLGVRECSWCHAQQKCVYNTECCETGDSNCCNNSPQTARFDAFTCRLKELCFTGYVLNATCPTSPPLPTAPPNTAIIAAGVVGGLFAALLLAFIVVLFVWYQFCRQEDLKDEHSKESAFDFSNKRTEATNPTNSDVVSDDGVMNKSVVSSQAPLVDSGKTTSEKIDLDATTL